MKQNTRQAWLVLTVAIVMIGGIAWSIPPAKEPGIWPFRIGALVSLGLLVGFYYWASRRKDRAPDFLSTLTKNFFERDGFAFIIGTETKNGIGYLSVTF